MSIRSTTISVVIPTFNRCGPLASALRSVEQQSRSADEVIVVDDGSQDETRAMLAEQFPQVCYLHQQNRGVSSARNLGITSARSEWIALLDSDDKWLPEKLANQLRLLDRLPDLLICHTEEIWVRNGRRVNPMRKHRKYGGAIFRHPLPLCVMSPSSVLIHRSLFERVGLFDESLPACEDYDLWLRICASHPVAFVDTPQIIKYGGHQDQLSRRFWGMDRFRLIALQKIIHSGSLDAEDRAAAKQMLVKKALILAKGAQKRGKYPEAEDYRKLASNYAAP